MPRVRPILLALATGIVGTSPGVARATCGLDQCPATSPASSPESLRGDVSIQQTSFRTDDAGGDYTAVRFRVDVLASARLQLRAASSFTTVRADGREASGWTNPVLTANVLVAQVGSAAILAGGQWETAWGDDTVSDDHHELLGYGRVRFGAAGWTLTPTLGYRHSVTAAEESSEPASEARLLASRTGLAFHRGHDSSDLSRFVAPHESRELLWRFGVRSPWAPVQAALDGQYVLAEEARGDHYVALDLVTPIALGDHLTGVPTLSRTLSAERRYDWRAGFRLEIR